MRDSRFCGWVGDGCNKGFFGVVTLLSFLTNYKLKLILFCKLFNFGCTRAQLESVQKFRIFNFMSFLGIGHEAFVLYVSVVLIIRLKSQILNHELFIIFIDTIVVTCLAIIFSFAASSKDDNFFVE